MLKRTKVRLGAVAALTATICIAGTMAANADPTAGSYPTLAGVGSDTTQDVMNGLATAIPAIGSYDAVDPATGLIGSGGAVIQTRATSSVPAGDAVSFQRPNGSGDGLNALSASYGGKSGSNYTYDNSVIKGEVDFARSSKGPAATGTDLTYIPFAADNVTYAFNSASDFPRNLPLGGAGDSDTTKLTLWNIYHCTATSYQNSKNQPVAIIPLLPQSGSGTRTFWETTFSLTDSSLPSCIQSAIGGKANEENNGKILNGPGYLIPFSTASYLAQGNASLLPSKVVERRGFATLGKIGGSNAYQIGGSAATGNLLQNSTNFPVTRPIYNVVDTAALGANSGSNVLASTFAGTSSSVCTNSQLILDYGFQTIDSSCGDTSLTGPFTQ